MAKRVVKVAIWEYRNAKGHRRRAYFGQTIELPEDELKRGDREGVFTPAPIPAMVPSELERALAGIVPRISDPAGSAESDTATLHHDIGAGVPVLVDDTAGGDDGADDPVTTVIDPSASATKPPARAASVEVWRKWVADHTDIAAEQIKTMTKDELRAAVKG